MPAMQTIFMYVVITLLMAPLLVLFGAPLVILGRLIYRWSASQLSGPSRLALACGIAALGTAPDYDAYGGPLPIYVRMFRGEPVKPLAALVSLALTWAILILLMRLISHRRRAHA